MKRRDFLKGILSTPVAAVALAKASTDLSVLSPKPSEVEDSEDMKKVREEEIEYVEEEFYTDGWSESISPSASCEYAEQYAQNLSSLSQQLECKFDDMILDILKGKK